MDILKDCYLERFSSSSASDAFCDVFYFGTRLEAATFHHDAALL
jgi:hypothetical protein